MNYTEVTFLIAPVDPWRDILMVELGELGFDSFEESYTDPGGGNGELKAYIPSEEYDRKALTQLLTVRAAQVTGGRSEMVAQGRRHVASEESSFQPVEVGKDVRIRADFHPTKEGFTHELVITPRMAFGTGHHATTRMMVQAMLRLIEVGREDGHGLDLAGKAVCDLGCGTGVLAILAERMGATNVIAIDNDQGAVDNAQENVGRNGCKTITVEKGDAASLKGHTYDVILANIERNVLLDAMVMMHDALRPGGALFLSGFVVSDRHMLVQRAKEVGLEPLERMADGDWALLGCRRPGHQ